MERYKGGLLFSATCLFLAACGPQPQRNDSLRKPPISVIRAISIAGSDEISNYNIIMPDGQNIDNGIIRIDLRPNAFSLTGRTRYEQVIPGEEQIISAIRAVNLYQLTDEGLFISAAPIYIQAYDSESRIESLKNRARNIPDRSKVKISDYDPRRGYALQAEWSNQENKSGYNIQLIDVTEPIPPVQALPNT